MPSVYSPLTPPDCELTPASGGKLSCALSLGLDSWERAPPKDPDIPTNSCVIWATCYSIISARACNSDTPWSPLANHMGSDWPGLTVPNTPLFSVTPFPLAPWVKNMSTSPTTVLVSSTTRALGVLYTGGLNVVTNPKSWSNLSGRCPSLGPKLSQPA